MNDFPTFARPCRCPEPVGDPREGTCILCGHQVPGHDLPVTRVGTLGPRPQAARKVHRGGPQSGLNAR